MIVVKAFIKRTLIETVVQLSNGCTLTKLFSAITVESKTLWSLLSIQNAFVPSGMVW